MIVEYFPGIIAVTVCLALGGILKGATGAGAPLLAVPALALFFDLHFAIVVMVIPNILTNFWQAWKFREHLPTRSFLAPLLIGSIIGVLIGTYILTSVPLSLLPVFLSFAIVGYIVLRLARPNWVLDMALATRLSLPAGIGAGFLQGASGISAPVSITFLNAIRLPRPVFVVTISSLFLALSIFQLAALWFSGVADGNTLMISAVALIPIAAAMPLGAKIAKKVDPAIFDKMILGLLSLIVLRLLFGFFF